MRLARPTLTVLLGLAAVGLLSGCEAAQQAADTANAASNAANKASVCLEAVKVAGFTPDLGNPQQALEETHKKAEELGKLAEQTGDTTLKQAIDGMATTMSQVTLSDLSPASAAQWLQEKADQLAKLTAACS